MLEERRGRPRTNSSIPARTRSDGPSPARRSKANDNRGSSPKASSPAFLSMTPVKTETGEDGAGGTPEGSPSDEPVATNAFGRPEDTIAPSAPPTELGETEEAPKPDAGELPHLDSPSSPRN